MKILSIYFQFLFAGVLFIALANGQSKKQQSKYNKNKEDINNKEIDNKYKVQSVNDMLYNSAKSLTQFQDSFMQNVATTLDSKHLVDSFLGYFNTKNNQDLKKLKKNQDLEEENTKAPMRKQKYGLTLESIEEDQTQIQKEIKKKIVPETLKNRKRKARELTRVFEEGGEGELNIGMQVSTDNISRLTQYCKNGGKTVIVQEKHFICNDEYVQYEEFMTDVLRANEKLEVDEIVYDNENIRWPSDYAENHDFGNFFYQNYDIKAANCTVYNGEAEACLCPQDWYGRYCEEENNIRCDVLEPKKGEALSTGNCLYEQTGYSKKFDGDPPCSPVRGEESIIINMKVACNNLYGERRESIILQYSDFYVVQWDKKVINLENGLYLSSNSDKFQYAFQASYTNSDGDELQLVSSTPVKFSPQITLIDWTNLSNSYEQSSLQGRDDKYEVTPEQLKGEDDFSILIDIGDVPKELELFGRYSMQLSVVQQKERVQTPQQIAESDLTVRYSYNQVTPKMNLYLDNFEYKIPKKKNGAKVWFIVVMVILSLLIIVAIVGIIRYYVKKINISKKTYNISQQNVNNNQHTANENIQGTNNNNNNNQNDDDDLDEDIDFNQ